MNRLTKIKEIRATLSSGGVSVGSWMQIPNSSIGEIMGDAGYDWIAVDMEHGTVSNHQLPDIFRAIELGNTLPVVRLASGAAKECKQALDAGAGGVIVPMVESASQLTEVRDACRWPPSGNRGVGFSRANLFGKNFATYTQEAQSPLLVAMIEDVRAIETLDSILAVEGLDAIFIGPYDLSASMGLTSQFDHSDFIDVMQQINCLANEYDVASGIHVVSTSTEELNSRIKEGYRFMAYSIDAVMLQSAVTRPV